MKISEVLEKLGAIQGKHGDIEVRVWDHEYAKSEGLTDIAAMKYKNNLVACIDLPDWEIDENL